MADIVEKHLSGNVLNLTIFAAPDPLWLPLSGAKGRCDQAVGMKDEP
jgi:hypothetical protein